MIAIPKIFNTVQNIVVLRALKWYLVKSILSSWSSHVVFFSHSQAGKLQYCIIKHFNKICVTWHFVEKMEISLKKWKFRWRNGRKIKALLKWLCDWFHWEILYWTWKEKLFSINRSLTTKNEFLLKNIELHNWWLAKNLVKWNSL